MSERAEFAALVDERELVESAADFVRLTAELAVSRARVVRLSRRMVQDATLTDEEAFVRASTVSMKALLEASRR